MQFLKADVAVKVVIGPAVAVADGFTPVTNLSLSGADEAEILKHDAASVTDISSNTFAAISSADGYYNLTLGTGDVDTEGMLTILINDDSLCLPILARFMVVNANVYDSLFAAATTDYLQVDTIQVTGTAQTANDNGADINAILIDTAEIGAAGAGLSAVPWNSNWDAEVESEVDDALGGGTGTALTAIPWNSSWDTEVQSECADALTAYDPPTRAELTTDKNSIITEIDANETKIDTLDTVADGIQTDLSNATDGLGALKTLIDAIQTQVDTTGVALLATAVDAIWDENLTGHSTANSGGLELRQLWTTLVVRVDQCGDAGSASTIDLNSGASAVTDYYKGQLIVITGGTGAGQSRSCTAYNGTTQVATIAPDWATVPDGDSWFAIINAGSTIPVTQALTDASIADAVWDEALADHTGTGSAGEALEEADEKRVINL